MRKYFIGGVLGACGALFLVAKQALAVCPLCTIAVGAGVGLSRWLGIDDSITGLWIGGLTVSLIEWTESWFDKKHIHFAHRHWATIVGYYSLVVIPLYFTGIMGHPANAVYGRWVDRLTVGIVVGSLGFWFGAEWYYALKTKNNGRAYFPFQKVIMPISPLVLMSIIFYIVTR